MPCDPLDSEKKIPEWHKPLTTEVVGITKAAEQAIPVTHANAIAEYIIQLRSLFLAHTW